MRRPYRERFTILLNELGTGLAGRGGDLRAVIRRANPALKEIDAVLAVLARQNRQLAALARNGDIVLRPLARHRHRVSAAIDNIGQVAAATAARRVALEATLRRLPRFLAELRPTMRRLGSFADLRVADLYAGSGALGFEALSRGAGSATFVENDAAASAIIKRNADKLKVTDRARIISTSAVTLPKSEPFDLKLALPEMK